MISCSCLTFTYFIIVFRYCGLDISFLRKNAMRASTNSVECLSIPFEMKLENSGPTFRWDLQRMNKKEGECWHLGGIKMRYSSCSCSFYIVHIMLLVMCLQFLHGTHHMTRLVRVVATWDTSRYSSCVCSDYMVRITLFVMCL